MGPMTLQTLVSVAMLGAFIWAVGFLLPKAIRAHDGLALTSAILTAILALFLWLWVGVGTRGSVVAQAVRGNHTSRGEHRLGFPVGDANPCGHTIPLKKFASVPVARNV